MSIGKIGMSVAKAATKTKNATKVVSQMKNLRPRMVGSNYPATPLQRQFDGAYKVDKHGLTLGTISKGSDGAIFLKGYNLDGHKVGIVKRANGSKIMETTFVPNGEVYSQTANTLIGKDGRVLREHVKPNGSIYSNPLYNEHTRYYLADGRSFAKYEQKGLYTIHKNTLPDTNKDVLLSVLEAPNGKKLVRIKNNTWNPNYPIDPKEGTCYLYGDKGLRKVSNEKWDYATRGPYHDRFEPIDFPKVIKDFLTGKIKA